MRIASVAAGFILAALIAYVVFSIGWGKVAEPAALQAQNPPSAFPNPLAITSPANDIELGRLLFFDPRLSGDVTTSCSSCHTPENAWADGIALADGYPSTLYFRNTPTLLNSSRMRLLYWDGRFAQRDMDSLVRDHLTEAHFMHVDGRLALERLRQVPEYVERFSKRIC